MSFDGSTLLQFGDIDKLIFPRSAIKPVQSMVLLESADVQNFYLQPQKIAFATSSRWSQSTHIELAQAWLSEMNLSEDQLKCGPHYPADRSAELVLIKQNRLPVFIICDIYFLTTSAKTRYHYTNTCLSK